MDKVMSKEIPVVDDDEDTRMARRDRLLSN